MKSVTAKLSLLVLLALAAGADRRGDDRVA